MASRKLDEYKPLSFYKKHTKPKQAGFSKFEVGGAYFFCRYSDGNIALISQAYSGVAGRNNGIVSVRTNEKISDRYKIEDRDGGQYGFALRAGNRQDIAISPDYATREAAEHVVGRLSGKIKAGKTVAKTASSPKAVASTAAAAAASTPKAGRTETYKPLAFYETHGGKSDGFNRFDKGGAYYFNYAQDGDVVLLSESYTSARGRDKGVASVEKNRSTAARYKFHRNRNGQHYFDLKAANHQEIATSRRYDSADGAGDGAKRLRGEIPLASAFAAAAGLTAGAALVAKSTNKAANDEQDYKPLAFYQDQTNGRAHGIESFTGEDGKYYFAYFENDKIALISEGYPTTSARDAGVASVEKNVGLKNRYDYRGPLKNGRYDYRLKAGNNAEIARSVWYGSAAAAAAGAAYLIGTRKRVPPVVAKPSVPLAAVAAAPIEAAAIAATAMPAPVSAPKPVPVPQAEYIAPVPVEEMGEGGGIWGWLKWLLLALVAVLAMFFLFEACAGEDGSVAPTPVGTQTGSAAAAPLVTCWNGSQAETLGACPAKITCWNGDDVTSRDLCPPEPAPTLTCWDDSHVDDLADCPAIPKAEPAPVTQAPVTTVQPMTSRGIGSSNAGVTAGIFKAGLTPVVVRRLGTNPEFGDSRTLGASAFYDKLNARYATNSFDRQYLDYLAGELGYNGWSEVTAADFTEATIANGTVGVLGFGDYHGYQYSVLDVREAADLEAFQLASRNRRDVYFMTRCGNYFFPT